MVTGDHLLWHVMSSSHLSVRNCAISHWYRNLSGKQPIALLDPVREQLVGFLCLPEDFRLLRLSCFLGESVLIYLLCCLNEHQHKHLLELLFVNLPFQRLVDNLQETLRLVDFLRLLTEPTLTDFLSLLEEQPLLVILRRDERRLVDFLSLLEV